MAQPISLWRVLRRSDLRIVGNFNEIEITEGASNVLEKSCFPFLVRKDDLSLTLISLEDLSLGESATREKIYSTAMKLRFSLCPQELGVELRLDYPDQPINERIIVASKPVDGNLFLLDGGKKPKLGTVGSAPGAVWRKEFKWVFVI